MRVVCMFRSDLQIRSKKDALEFYDGVRGLILIPAGKDVILRIEPGKQIGFLAPDDIRKERAAFVPNFYDDDGSIAYAGRKYINAYLRGED